MNTDDFDYDRSAVSEATGVHKSASAAHNRDTAKSTSDSSRNAPAQNQPRQEYTLGKQDASKPAVVEITQNEVELPEEEVKKIERPDAVCPPVLAESLDGQLKGSLNDEKDGGETPETTSPLTAEAALTDGTTVKEITTKAPIPRLGRRVLPWESAAETPQKKAKAAKQAHGRLPADASSTIQTEPDSIMSDKDDDNEYVPAKRGRGRATRAAQQRTKTRPKRVKKARAAKDDDAVATTDEENSAPKRRSKRSAGGAKHTKSTLDEEPSAFKKVIPNFLNSLEQHFTDNGYYYFALGF